MTAGGNITRRGKTSWRLKFEGPRDPETGRRNIQYHTVRGSKADAKVKLAELVAAVGGNTYVEPSALTVAALVAERIKLWQASGKISAKTAERREQLAKNQISRIGRILVQKIDTPDVERWHVDMLVAGLAPRTVRDAHSLLRQALDEAEKHRIVPRNVARLQKPPKVPHEEVEIIGAEEIGPTLKKLEGHPLYNAVIVALDTGIRRAEQLALIWDDVDLDAKTLKIRRALEETKAHGIRIKPTKNRRSRTITLPDRTVAILREHRRQQLELRMALGAGRMPDDALLFPADPIEGGYRSPRNFSTTWGRVVARLGLPKVTWHVWRHTHASILIDRGVDIVKVSCRLGHQNANITLLVYSHLVSKDDQAAADAINAMAAV